MEGQPLPIELPDITVICPDPAVEHVFSSIHQRWEQLVKTSPPYSKGELFSLPFPYVVPGGVYQQLFYWDSYFIILGLNISRLHELARSIVNNFFYELKTFGIIPNSSELAHLSRSQPPLLTSMIEEVWRGDKEWLRSAYEWTKIEYKEVWMDETTHYHPQIGLNKYYDRLESMLRVKGEAYLHFDEMYIPPAFWHERVEAESGWDYTGRFHRQCGYFIPVDLNALLYKYETDLAAFARLLALNGEAEQWEQAAKRRKDLMNQYLWNESFGMCFDFHFLNGRQHCYYSLAAFYPLWARAASKQQAAKVVRHLPLFLRPGGLAASNVQTGFQWDFPNGWAPLHWIVIKGLQNYGYDLEAQEIAWRWIRLCTKVYLETGNMYEKYNVVDMSIRTVGRYPSQKGFGWTNAVYQKIAVDLLGCTVC